MGNQKSLDSLFDRLLTDKTIFVNKEVLRHSYTPDQLPHRQKQIGDIASVLVPVLKGETPSNIFVYGKTGTGKTAVVKHVGKALVGRVGGNYFSKPFQNVKNVPDFHSLPNGKCSCPVWFIYMNCEVVDTQYRLLAKLGEYFGQSIPLTGWPTDKVYDTFFSSIDKEKRLVIIVLDEIDRLMKKGSDEVLYNLTRINSDLVNAKVSIIGITNDLNFIDFLDPRIRSSLGEEELIFPPYDAIQLQDILAQRAKLACNTRGVIDLGVIPLCAAFAAQEHGDARKALDLFRVAGEHAEREHSTRITEKHVREAKERIEKDRIVEVVKTLPTQSKLILYSCILLEKYEPSGISTGEVYNVYKDLCKMSPSEILTQRRISDIISELDMLGILNAKVVSKGRYGRTKEIHLGIPITQIKRVLEQDRKIERVVTYVPPLQHKLS
ncbi:MAG: Cdc6/Cdc18 family protein [Candidatus Methanofastidiosia archaeon]